MSELSSATATPSPTHPSPNRRGATTHKKFVFDLPLPIPHISDRPDVTYESVVSKSGAYWRCELGEGKLREIQAWANAKINWIHEHIDKTPGRRLSFRKQPRYQELLSIQLYLKNIVFLDD